MRTKIAVLATLFPGSPVTKIANYTGYSFQIWPEGVEGIVFMKAIANSKKVFFDKCPISAYTVTFLVTVSTPCLPSRDQSAPAFPRFYGVITSPANQNAHLTGKAGTEASTLVY